MNRTITDFLKTTTKKKATDEEPSKPEGKAKKVR